MVQAYILVQTEVGKAADVARQIAEIAGVMEAEDVTGPYDVIVRAQAENMDELGKLVAAQIQAVAGITRTLTCPMVRVPTPRMTAARRSAGVSTSRRSPGMPSSSSSLAPLAACRLRDAPPNI